MTLTFYVQFPETDKPVYPKQGGGSTTDIKEAMILPRKKPAIHGQKSLLASIVFNS